MITINFFGEDVNLSVVFHKYNHNNRIAVEAVCDDESFGMISTNIPEANLAENEICVKTWSENSSWVPQLLEACPHMFVPTGRYANSGFVSAPIYKVVCN